MRVNAVGAGQAIAGVVAGIVAGLTLTGNVNELLEHPWRLGAILIALAIAVVLP